MGVDIVTEGGTYIERRKPGQTKTKCWRIFKYQIKYPEKEWTESQEEKGLNMTVETEISTFKKPAASGALEWSDKIF